MLLGAGTWLFDHLGGDRIELDRLCVDESPQVTDRRFRVRNTGPFVPDRASAVQTVERNKLCLDAIATVSQDFSAGVILR